MLLGLLGVPCLGLPFYADLAVWLLLCSAITLEYVRTTTKPRCSCGWCLTQDRPRVFHMDALFTTRYTCKKCGRSYWYDDFTGRKTDADC